MKQSIIGSYRPTDNLSHWDRTNGRPAPNDFIVRMENEQIKAIVPDQTDEVRNAIVHAISLLLSGSVKTPCTVIARDVSVRISYVINQ